MSINPDYVGDDSLIDYALCQLSSLLNNKIEDNFSEIEESIRIIETQKNKIDTLFDDIIRVLDTASSKLRSLMW